MPIDFFYEDDDGHTFTAQMTKQQCAYLNMIGSCPTSPIWLRRYLSPSFCTLSLSISTCGSRRQGQQAGRAQAASSECGVRWRGRALPAR